MAQLNSNGAETPESDGGYDSELFDDRDKAAEFKCPICTCIAKVHLHYIFSL